MRRSFVQGVLVFGAAAATALAAYVRVGMGQSWSQVVLAWLLGFTSLALAPLASTLLSPLFWASVIGRREARDERRHAG